LICHFRLFSGVYVLFLLSRRMLLTHFLHHDALPSLADEDLWKSSKCLCVPHFVQTFPSTDAALMPSAWVGRVETRCALTGRFTVEQGSPDTATAHFCAP
jgi:hypothetical protein